MDSSVWAARVSSVRFEFELTSIEPVLATLHSKQGLHRRFAMTGTCRLMETDRMRRFGGKPVLLEVSSPVDADLNPFIAEHEVTHACGSAVFGDPEDPDYTQGKAILVDICADETTFDRLHLSARSGLEKNRSMLAVVFIASSKFPLTPRRIALPEHIEVGGDAVFPVTDFEIRWPHGS